MKVICKNAECRTFDIEANIFWDGLDTYILYQRLSCPLCGKQREIISEPEEKQSDLSTISFGKIAGMDIIEKKSFLKKRSNEHYQREIKERKQHMDNIFYKTGERP